MTETRMRVDKSCKARELLYSILKVTVPLLTVKRGWAGISLSKTDALYKKFSSVTQGILFRVPIKNTWFCMSILKTRVHYLTLFPFGPWAVAMFSAAQGQSNTNINLSGQGVMCYVPFYLFLFITWLLSTTFEVRIFRTWRQYMYM